MASKTKITLTLSRANAGAAAYVAAILKKPISEVVSSCLKGSTNPKAK